MGKLQLRPAVPEDVFRFTPRAEDAMELAVMHPGDRWREHLALALTTYASAGSITAENDDGIVAIFGVVREGNNATPWLLCAGQIDRYSKRLMRHARGVVEHLQTCADKGGLVFNHISRQAVQARRFVKALGFVIVPTPGWTAVDFFYLPPREPASHV